MRSTPSNASSPIRRASYSIRGGRQRLVVHLVPFADNVSLHGPAIHEISPHVGSPVIMGRGPSQHHVVLDSLKQGHSGGPSRDGCGEKDLPHVSTVPLAKGLTPPPPPAPAVRPPPCSAHTSLKLTENRKYNRWSTYTSSEKRGNARTTSSREPG